MLSTFPLWNAPHLASTVNLSRMCVACVSVPDTGNGVDSAAGAANGAAAASAFAISAALARPIWRRTRLRHSTGRQIPYSLTGSVPKRRARLALEVVYGESRNRSAGKELAERVRGVVDAGTI